MDSMAGPVEPHGDPADSPNMRIIKAVFATIAEVGLEASLDDLLEHAHEDIELRPYVARGRALRGRESVRAFYREELARGTALHPRPSSFEDHGDEIVVKGSLRIVRPEGGFAESQISWRYRFRDGRVEAASSGPRQAA